MIYENVLSVAFIYAMGVYRGRTADPEKLITDSINFYQQTPNDPTIGDLMAHWKGKMFIVEFKSTIKQLDAETDKATKVNLLKAFEQDKSIVDLSARGHFIGYGHYEIKGAHTLADLIFNPYITLVFGDPKPGNRFNAFIQKLDGDKRFGWSREDMAKYMTFLKANISAPASGSRSTSSGGRSVKETEGLITVVAPDNKILTLTFKTYEELDQLMSQRITLSQYLNQQLQQSKTLQQSIQKQQAKEQSNDQSIGGPRF